MRGAVRRALLLALALSCASGCYRSHGRGQDGGLPRSDAGTDAAADIDATIQPIPHTGCRVACEEPELVGLLRVLDHAEEDYDAPRLFVEAREVGEAIVVLMTRPDLGHTSPAHRLLFFDPETGAFTMSEAWEGEGLFPQHHDGARILPSPPERVRVLALMGRPELGEGTVPTGNQTVGVYVLEWSLEGELVSERMLTRVPGDPTEGCPGGCEAAITIDGDRAVVSYAPAGVLYSVELDLAGDVSAGEWTEAGFIDDPRRAPWPHVAATFDGERWIAGGGAYEFEPVRAGWFFGPGTREPLPGSDNDPPPILLGGDALILARHIEDERRFRIERITDGSVVHIPTGPGLTPLSSHASITSAGRVLLAWSAHAPGSFRDTVVTLTPDVPEELCGEVQPATLLRIPEAVAHPSVLAHEHRGVTYLFALPNSPSGDDPEIAVFAIRGCALVP